MNLGMKDLSKPGDRRRQIEEQRAAELRLRHLLEYQRVHREQLCREAAADALYGGGDLPGSRVE